MEQRRIRRPESIMNRRSNRNKVKGKCDASESALDENTSHRSHIQREQGAAVTPSQRAAEPKEAAGLLCLVPDADLCQPPLTFLSKLDTRQDFLWSLSGFFINQTRTPGFLLQSMMEGCKHWNRHQHWAKNQIECFLLLDAWVNNRLLKILGSKCPEITQKVLKV